MNAVEYRKNQYRYACAYAALFLAQCFWCGLYYYEHGYISPVCAVCMMFNLGLWARESGRAEVMMEVVAIRDGLNNISHKETLHGNLA